MRLIPNLFTKYELSPEETISGSILTTLNRACIQNLIADYAADKVSLKFDSTAPQIFVQQEAELQGKILILQHLLDLSDAAEKEASSSTPT